MPLSPQGPLVPPMVVALGAIPGAWLRYALVKRASGWLPRPHWGTWGVNMLACFLMGLFVGLKARLGWPDGATLELAFAVGFLGSMSTYSTWMADLVMSWQRQGKGQAVVLAAASLLGGLLACQLGLALAQGGRS
jgi:CrcB protein